MRAIDIIMSKKFGRGKKGMVIGWPELLKVAGGTATDIVGATPPITLADAIKGKIVKLTQYGLCTTADGDIFCNNGKLTAVHRSGLPSGYKLLEYIGGSGSQYIVTDLYLASTDIVECEYKNSTTTGYGAIYGVYKMGESSALYGNRTYYGYDESNTAVNTDVPVDTEWHSSRHDFVNGSLTVDDTTVTFTPFEFTNSTKNAVLSRYYNGSYGYNWRGYVRKFKVTRGGEVICDLLPAKDSNDVAGLYDLISGDFYTATGGTLLEGNEVDDYELAVVGTPEVISITASGADTQTASVVNLFSTGTVHDEVEIISGTVTRRTAVSVSGGVITISALATPVTESVTPQPLHTNAGDNVISVTANVSPIEFDVTYMKGA